MKASARGNTFEPSELDRYAQAWENPGSLTSMLNYYRSLRERRVGEPTRIASPTLMLSERDSFLGEHVARASLGLCDDGRLRIIAGATHWLHLEEPPDKHRVYSFLSNDRGLGYAIAAAAMASSSRKLSAGGLVDRIVPPPAASMRRHSALEVAA